MPFQTACPNCKATYKVNESPQARKINCKRCNAPFVIPARPAAPVTSPLQTGVRPASGPAHFQGGHPMRPAHEHLPLLEPLPEKSSGKLFLILGIAAAVLILAGGGVGAFFLLNKPLTEEEKLALAMKKAFEGDGDMPNFNNFVPNINEVKKGQFPEISKVIPPELGKAFPPEIGKLNPPEIGKFFPPEVGKVTPPEIGKVNPTPPSQGSNKTIDKMTAAELMAKAELNQFGVSDEAFRELARRDPKVPERVEIAKRLAAFVESNNSPFMDPISPLAVWATRDQTVAIVGFIQKDRGFEKLVPWLAAQEGEKALPVLFDTLARRNDGTVRTALESLGDKATPALLEHAFKRNYPARQTVREILKKQAVEPDKLLPAAVAALQQGNAAEKLQVLHWLREEKVAPQEAHRPAIAKSLNEFIKPTNVNDDVITLLKDWGTKDNAAAVMAALRGARSDRVEPYLDFIASLGGDEALPIFLEYLDKPFVDRKAADGLRKLGPDVAPKLAPLAFHRNGTIRHHVQEVLKDWNTKIELILPYAVDAAVSNEPESRGAGRDWLVRTNPGDVKRDDVSKKLDALLQDRDLGATMQILAKWGDKENVPSLLKLVGKPGVPRTELYRTLGRIRDERAIPVVVGRINATFERGDVLDFCREIGPELGEKPLLAYLNDPQAHNDVRKLLEEWKIKPAVLLEQTLKDLGSDQMRTKEEALRYLGAIPIVEAKRDDVLKIITPIIEEERTTRETAKAYFVYADASCVDTLIKLVTKESFNHRRDAMDALSRFPEQKSAMAIASRLTHFSEHKQAVDLLKKMGPVSEAPCIMLLQNKDSRVRTDAVNVLADVGTTKCLKAMITAGLMYGNDRTFMEAGARAQNAIKARTPPTKK